MPLTRVTYFKIPKVADQQALIAYYRAMPTKAVKDGKPYIRSVRAGPAKDDPRSKGFTFAAISVFDSLADMQYYDNGCAAHAELRSFAQSVHEGAMVVYFEDVLGEADETAQQRVG
ncbi:hypothetical protein SEUCBS140593_009175 [Sporothrix eucalyptigena]|uniref:Stress-response A/B barrel domain-containing protein n=1 Tax=Sporothrix eucalyptigena TaxID=1812306 RepID=A0ABP0CSN0_9PEZI